MTEQLLEIGGRLKGLRGMLDIPVEEMARVLQLSEAEYLAYERGERDFSFSFLSNAAGTLGVDIVELISGESPRLKTGALTRKGEGFDIKRQDAYLYKHLAFTFSNKKAEPFLVTVEPSEAEAPATHTHEGQEFNYMVSGRMEFQLGGVIYTLNEGDSMYFDSGVPHAMRALDGQPVQFIAVVIK